MDYRFDEDPTDDHDEELLTSKRFFNQMSNDESTILELQTMQ